MRSYTLFFRFRFPSYYVRKTVEGFAAILFVLMITEQRGNAQTSRMEVRLLNFYSNATSGTGDNRIEHTWQFSYKDDTNDTYTPARCHSYTSSDSDHGRWFDLDDDTYSARYYYNINTVPDYITVHLLGYEDDVGSRCELDGRDDQDERGDLTIRLQDFAPGVWSQTFVVWAGTRYGIIFQLRYTPVAPAFSSISPTGNICADASTTIAGAINLTNKTGLTYEWQYNIQGDTYPNPDFNDCSSTCYDDFYTCLNQGNSYSICAPRLTQCNEDCANWYPPDLPNWQPLGTTAADTRTFTATPDLFPSGIIRNTNVQFRLRVHSSEVTTYFSAASGFFSFIPQAPTSAEQFVTEMSCPLHTPTGKIVLNGVVSAFTNYRYILKRGDIAALGCDPQAGNCLSDVEQSGLTSGSTLTLSNIPVGAYSLFLLNEGGQQGVCPRKINATVTIDSVPALNVSAFIPSEILCNGANDGSIAYTLSGGRSASVEHTLLNSTLSQSSTTTTVVDNASTSFTGLKPGAYQLTVDDECTTPVVRTFQITQPVKISVVEFTDGNATCNSPGNASVQVSVQRSASPDVSVDTNLLFQLYKDNVLYDELDSAVTAYTWAGTLPPSENYHIVVKEKGGADCNAFVQDFDIDPAPELTLTNLSVDSVSCFDGNNGRISIEGGGGTGDLVYVLSGAMSDDNSTGIFENLVSGTYSVTVKNSIACNDALTQTLIEVKQPDDLIAIASKTDITCFDKNDGTLAVAVSGGNDKLGPYTYQWQTSTNSGWSDLSNKTDPAVINQFEGLYRVQVKDAKICTAFSNTVEIIRPEEISIDLVTVNDIKCFGEAGSIAIESSKGTSTHTYSYSLNDDTQYKAFTSATPLYAGEYKIRVHDINGCPKEDANTYVITSPTEPLTFSSELSDFNGFQISCFGGSNGSATLTPTGGNGAHYLGYEYGVDSRPFDDAAEVTGINAGTHTLKVRDDRGCIVTQSATFTQTEERLAPALVDKRDVLCFGDTDGGLEINATGGLPPYRFSIDGVSYIDAGKYEGLAPGDYTIVVMDKNNCDTQYSDQINIITPVIELESTVKDVSCFNGSDGEIATSVTGGDQPLSYEWTGTTSSSANVTNLTAGTYIVKVSDESSCAREFTIEVIQPLKPLQLQLVTVPVCYGRTNGVITAFTSGGTNPYQFSLDGQVFQTENIFYRGVGDYTVTSQDENGCISTAVTTIIQRNDRPEPNFLVATKRNALDTLVVSDISIPKPDSIHWVFDPAALVLSDDQFNPEIKFSDAGTYSVTMTGYFGACDYAVTKVLNVNPYDPDAVLEQLPGYEPIQSLEVTPNPSNGQFEVKAKLSKKYNVSLVIYDVVGGIHYRNNWESIEELNQPVALNGLASGLYLVRLVTESDAKEVRMVITK
jgi:uncharacterized protein (DUF2141 family)